MQFESEQKINHSKKLQNHVYVTSPTEITFLHSIPFVLYAYHWCWRIVYVKWYYLCHLSVFIKISLTMGRPMWHLTTSGTNGRETRQHWGCRFRVFREEIDGVFSECNDSHWHHSLSCTRSPKTVSIGHVRRRNIPFLLTPRRDPLQEIAPCRSLMPVHRKTHRWTCRKTDISQNPGPFFTTLIRCFRFNHESLKQGRDIILWHKTYISFVACLPGKELCHSR